MSLKIKLKVWQNKIKKKLLTLNMAVVDKNLKNKNKIFTNIKINEEKGEK